MARTFRTRVGRFVLLNSYSDHNGFSFTLRTARNLANVEVVVAHRQLLAGWWN